jgi:hypothetical protein
VPGECDSTFIHLGGTMTISLSEKEKVSTHRLKFKVFLSYVGLLFHDSKSAQ